MKSLGQIRKEASAAKAKLDEARTIQNWKDLNPSLALDANVATIREAHHGDEMTVASMNEVAAHLIYTKSTRLSQMRDDQVEIRNQQAEEQQAIADELEKSQLIEDLVRAYSPHEPSQINERIRLNKFSSLDEVRKRHADMLEKRRLRGMTKEEVKAEVIANKPIQAQYQPLQGLNLNRDYLISLSPVDLRSVITKHGLENVNRVLAQKE